MAAILGASLAPLKIDSSARRPVRVLVVDDSVVMRQLITRMLGSVPDIEVIGIAKDGRDAFVKVGLLKPDLVTLDVEMPNLDGIGALKLIKQSHPNTRVIMCSSLTARGASTTVDALIYGADDYVTKQRSGEMTASAFDTLRHDLVSTIRRLFCLRNPGDINREASIRTTFDESLNPPPAQYLGKTAPRVLCIGVSTGGPTALVNLLSAFPADFPLPVLIVQHMPPFFTTALAERLSKISKLPVHEASPGMPVLPRQALLAPGDFHMRVVKRLDGVQIALDQGERESFCRPAVDVLFRSVSEVYGGAVIATVLTGMGSDGLAGVRVLKGLGAAVLVQNKETSVVWGMPGAIAEARLADAVLPLQEIYPAIARLL